MKILHTVEFYFPSVGGMQEVVKQLSERMVKLGHDVTIATTKLAERKDGTINGVKIREFSISGNLAKGFKGDVEEYKKFLLDSDFDIVTNFAAQQWATDVALTVLDGIKAKKVFVPTGFSGLYMKEYKNYFEEMKEWMRKYDMNIFLSDDYRDVNFAKENNIAKRILIPNGAGEDEFLAETGIDIRKKMGIPENNFLILHVGSHTGVKGHKEAIKIFQKARIKNATFLIIANKLLGGCTIFCALKEKSFKRSLKRFFDRKRLVISSLSRKETVAAYQAADLFLFPSNIECSPIVLFECMAAKTPFLTSDVGNSKEIIEWSGAGILLPTSKDQSGYGLSYVDIKKSTKILEEMYRDKEKRGEMARKGFEVWKEKFSWEKITGQYESLYEKLLSKE
jgi:glycosyltransferase involved in cell wall biosynthesis